MIANNKKKYRIRSTDNKKALDFTRELFLICPSSELRARLYLFSQAASGQVSLGSSIHSKDRHEKLFKTRDFEFRRRNADNKKAPDFTRELFLIWQYLFSQAVSSQVSLA